MRIVLISDTHGPHRKLELPNGDLLVHAGDFTLYATQPCRLFDFNEWLGELRRLPEYFLPEYFLPMRIQAESCDTQAAGAQPRLGGLENKSGRTNLEVSLFEPRLGVLPLSQRRIWNELASTPPHFVLYGGTAVALRLGHRQSEDFDFFSNQDFEPSDLIYGVGYLKQARFDRRGDNTLSVVVERGEPVRLSFLGDLHMGHVHEPDVAPDNSLQIASLLDLLATKLKTIQQPAEAKDYRDIDAGHGAGISLEDGLAAATAVYGKTFNPLATLKALAYFKDGNLPTLSAELQERLLRAATLIEMDELPQVVSKPGITRLE